VKVFLWVLGGWALFKFLAYLCAPILGLGDAVQGMDIGG
jgi:hypothetical protein